MLVRIVCDDAVALIKKWEKLELAVYKDQAGLLTVGWGHRTSLPLGTLITEAQAEFMFEYDINAVANGLVNAFDSTQLNDHQFGALASFVYNIGIENFLLPKQGGSQVLKALRKEKWDDVPVLMKAWIHITLPSGTRAQSDGLINRRQAERVLWLTPMPQLNLPLEDTSNGV